MTMAPLSPVSERFRLAQAARDAALTVSGVVDLDAGPGGVFMTAERDQGVPGVVCAATTDGYDLSLRVVAGLVPLEDLGREVSAAVRAAASARQLPTGRVDIHVADVREPLAALPPPESEADRQDGLASAGRAGS